MGAVSNARSASRNAGPCAARRIWLTVGWLIPKRRAMATWGKASGAKASTTTRACAGVQVADKVSSKAIAAP